MRILVVEDEFEYLNDELVGAPTVPVRGVGYTLAKATS
jgi:hypothetical protein